jgi:cholest-4-en-3-one 26-monooxygenase
MSGERIDQLRLWMINQDAPGHTKLRKLVNKGFTLRMIQKMEAHIHALSKEIIDNVARKGECDFVASIASELPLLVIAELVGCPLEDRQKLFQSSLRRPTRRTPWPRCSSMPGASQRFAGAIRATT